MNSGDRDDSREKLDADGWGTGIARLLHRLRLKGAASVADLAGSHAESDQVEGMLAALEMDGFVRSWAGDPVRWQQTATGRSQGEQLLAVALSALGGRDLVEGSYRAFVPLNGEFLELCTQWQVRDVDGQQRPNDHIDERYDRAVIRRLGLLDARIQPLVKELGLCAGRFGHYAERFENALACIESGEQEWFTKPGVDSYHTVWFELHEDLLATLGYERSSERS